MWSKTTPTAALACLVLWLLVYPLALDVLMDGSPSANGMATVSAITLGVMAAACIGLLLYLTYHASRHVRPDGVIRHATVAEGLGVGLMLGWIGLMREGTFVPHDFLGKGIATKVGILIAWLPIVISGEALARAGLQDFVSQKFGWRLSIALSGALLPLAGVVAGVAEPSGLAFLACCGLLLATVYRATAHWVACAAITTGGCVAVVAIIPSSMIEPGRDIASTGRMLVQAAVSASSALASLLALLFAVMLWIKIAHQEDAGKARARIAPHR